MKRDPAPPAAQLRVGCTSECQQLSLRGFTALDLAVTSRMRRGCLLASGSDGGRAVRDCESRKQVYQETEAQCKHQGIQFLLPVFEACGAGFSPTPLGTIRAVSSLAAARTGEPATVVAEKMQQALSSCLQREAARLSSATSQFGVL